MYARYSGPAEKAATAVYFERGCGDKPRWLSVTNREHPFTYADERWDSVQQCYEAQKFPDEPVHRERIRAAESWEEVARLGSSTEFPLPQKWRAGRSELMEAIAQAQADAHDELALYLVSTRDKWFQCAETLGSRNMFWYSEKNEMGRVWAHVRAACKKRADAAALASKANRYISLREYPTFVMPADGSPTWKIEPSGTHVEIEYNPVRRLKNPEEYGFPWWVKVYPMPTIKSLRLVGPPIDLHQPGKIYLVDYRVASERHMLPELDDVELGHQNRINGGVYASFAPHFLIGVRSLAFIGRKGDVDYKTMEPTAQLIARRERGDTPEET